MICPSCGLEDQTEGNCCSRCGVAVTVTGEIADDRRTFDDVDDYHGWFASPPQLRNGDPIDMYEGWSRGVSVSRVNPATLAAT